MLVGMALGVAVVFAVDIANDSAKRAFSLSLDTVTGRTTHQIVGGTEGIDESLYTRLRTELGIRSSAPVVEGRLTLQANDESGTTETLQLLGVDIFAEPMFRDQSFSASTSTRDSLGLLQKGSLILADTTAARLGVNIGESINTSNSNLQLTLLNTVDASRQAGFETIAMVDISTAQHLLNSPGKLSRIDLILPDTDSGAGTALKENQTGETIERIQSALPGVSIVDAERRNESLTQMTAAFHTNLLAMSLLALLVGAFLIYNTVTLSVIQRRKTFGQLRTLGIQRHELFRSILLETFLFAVAGTIAGVLLGYLLGEVLLTLVTRSINDLFFTLDVRQVNFSSFNVAKALFIGIIVSLLAALAPAIEASRSTPVTVLRRTSVETRITNLVPIIFVAGLALVIAGGIILWLSQTSLWAGFLAIFCIVLGYSMAIPRVMIGITTISEHRAIKSLGTMGNYPFRSMTASLSRTAVAVAALAISVSATAGVGIMIGSFRLSVENWLGSSLQADLYISSTADDQSNDGQVPADLIDQIQSLPGVSGTRLARFTETDTNIAPVRVMALGFTGSGSLAYQYPAKLNQPTALSSGTTSFAAATEAQQVKMLNTSDTVLISEPFANQNNLAVGDVLNIKTTEGVVPFKVAAIFTNYTTGKGLLVISLSNYNKYWNDQQIDSIGVSFTDRTRSKATQENIRALVQQQRTALSIRSDADIRDQSLEIFDQTFAITHVLRLLTVGVAFIGILSALMALSLERRAEYAVLRALGTTPAELRKLLFYQTGLMGLIAGVLALPLGIAMSKILVSIINVRSFGWSMEYLVPYRVLLESMLLAIAAALVAGLYPAIKLSRLSPAEALRHQ